MDVRITLWWLSLLLTVLGQETIPPPNNRGLSSRCSECPSHAPVCRNDSLCYNPEDITPTTTLVLGTATHTIQPSTSTQHSSTLYTQGTLTHQAQLHTLSSRAITQSQTSHSSTPTQSRTSHSSTPTQLHASHSSTAPHPHITPSLVLQTITITITQTVNFSNFCPCNDEMPCLEQGRLPILYVALIGVIPSTVAIALLFLLFIVVCANRRRKKRVKNTPNVRFQDTNTVDSRSRMQIRDSGVTTRQNTGLHLRSPLKSPSPSVEVDRPLLPDPPTPNFDENPTRGATFNFAPRNSAFFDSSFSYSNSSYSTEATVHDTQRELADNSMRLPVVGLESINEERNEGTEGAGQVGVANIIAQLERGKGRIVATEC